MAKLRAGSIWAIVSKVGDFHIIERASTLVFVDHVIRSVVNVLVTL